MSKDEDNVDLNVQAPYYIGKNGTTHWCYAPVQPITQTKALNIVRMLLELLKKQS